MPYVAGSVNTDTGLNYARSATLMDDTLTSVSLEPMRKVTKLNRKSLRTLEKSGHHDVLEGILKSQESFTVPVHVSCVHTDPDNCSNISARISLHPVVLVAHGAVTNSEDTTIKLHSARCCESPVSTEQKAAFKDATQFPATPPEFCTPCQNQLHNCEFPQVPFRCGSGRTLSFSPSRPPNPREFTAHGFHKLHDLWSW